MDDQEEVEEMNLVRTSRDAVIWLVEVAGCSEVDAVHALTQTAGNISDAIDLLPSIHNTSIKGTDATEQEIRRLINSADQRMSSSDQRMSSSRQSPKHDVLPKDEIIDISDSEGDSSNGEEEKDNNIQDMKTEQSVSHNISDTIQTADEVVHDNSKVAERLDSVQEMEVADNVDDKSEVGDVSKKDTGRSEDEIIARVALTTGVSRDRAKAALTMAGGKEDDAVQIIQVSVSRHPNRKRRKTAENTSETPEVSSLQPLRPKDVLVMSWNVDGLCERGFSERFSAVISQIKTCQPHVVLLQEVVDEHVSRIRSSLGVSFDLTFGDRSSAYYNAILINKKVGSVKIVDKCVRKFPKTLMGRHYVQVTCELFEQKMTILTSHLESMKDHSLERVSQANKILIDMNSIDKENVVIFGGDTNLRDSEMNRVVKWDTVYDVWERLGSNKDTRYTWDTSINKNNAAPYKSKLRFDRLFVRDSPTFIPKSLNLIGTTLLQSCDMYPSDHWGLMTNFTILPTK